MPPWLPGRQRPASLYTGWGAGGVRESSYRIPSRIIAAAAGAGCVLLARSGLAAQYGWDEPVHDAPARRLPPSGALRAPILPCPGGAVSAPLPVSCGTLVVNPQGQLLLCHVTNTARWDIPKGMQDEGETPLQAAMRELMEEAGVCLPKALFEDLGSFDYRRDKRLHLFRVAVADELGDLSQLACTSFFPHPKTGRPTLEADGFRWAGRDELAQLCWPRMGQLLLSLQW
ncbi:NUDIX domain-containing protein [Massilia sp. PAMC28688]|uniref:NUDIX hydrolase n=1 Tax=Massilia sp. PAMC28688 TaxID=2861283 RepID=UPI001C63342E|nr:NUDIX domain-containing protein [Massilia sp. PAMC28688]QYF92931.1 NUDIX domain-containing protein [Massilia sp. PAMC28688]